MARAPRRSTSPRRKPQPAKSLNPLRLKGVRREPGAFFALRMVPKSLCRYFRNEGTYLCSGIAGPETGMECPGLIETS